MAATIKNVREAEGQYEFTVDMDGTLQLFRFPLTVTNAEVRKGIKDKLDLLEEKNARLTQLRKRFVGEVIQ